MTTTGRKTPIGSWETAEMRFEKKVSFGSLEPIDAKVATAETEGPVTTPSHSALLAVTPPGRRARRVAQPEREKVINERTRRKKRIDLIPLFGFKFFSLSPIILS